MIWGGRTSCVSIIEPDSTNGDEDTGSINTVTAINRCKGTSLAQPEGGHYLVRSLACFDCSRALSRVGCWVVLPLSLSFARFTSLEPKSKRPNHLIILRHLLYRNHDGLQEKSGGGHFSCIMYITISCIHDEAKFDGVSYQ